MKINKFLLPIFSIILLTSCSNVNYHIDDLTFDECNLYLKDFSEVSGHHNLSKQSRFKRISVELLLCWFLSYYKYSNFRLYVWM